MLRLVRLTLTRLGAHPVRSVLVITTLAVGTAVVALAFLLRSSVGHIARVTLPSQGARFVIANGEYDASGIWDWETPNRFTAADGPELLAQDSSLTAVTPYESRHWPSVYAGGRNWRLRGVAGTGPEYKDIMGLELTAGVFLRPEDEEQAARVVVLSEAAARAIFGDAVAALGQEMVASTGMVFMVEESGMSAGGPTEVKDTFRVVGVFRDPPGMKRDAYGIPEALIPHRSLLPPGMPMALGVRTLVAHSNETRREVVEQSVRAVMASTYGDEVSVSVWEGDPGSPTGGNLEDTRSGILGFSVMVGVLALVILLLSSFGVFSSLMAEGVDSGRETGILRAVGASVRSLRLLVVLRAGTLGLVGGALGVAGAAALHQTVWTVLGPLLGGLGLGTEDIAASGLSPLALLLALGCAVASAGLFGLLPASLAGRVSIVESIRES